MTCKDAWEAISDRIDESLEVVHERALNQHLAQCRRCAAAHAGIRNLIRLCRDERVFVLPDGFLERLEKRLREMIAAGELPQY